MFGTLSHFSPTIYSYCVFLLRIPVESPFFTKKLSPLLKGAEPPGPSGGVCRASWAPVRGRRAFWAWGGGAGEVGGLRGGSLLGPGSEIRMLLLRTFRRGCGFSVYKKKFLLQEARKKPELGGGAPASACLPWALWAGPLELDQEPGHPMAGLGAWASGHRGTSKCTAGSVSEWRDEPGILTTACFGCCPWSLLCWDTVTVMGLPQSLSLAE